MFLVVHSIDDAQPILVNVDTIVSAEEHNEGITYLTLSNGEVFEILNTVEDIFAVLSTNTTEGE